MKTKTNVTIGAIATALIGASFGLGGSDEATTTPQETPKVPPTVLSESVREQESPPTVESKPEPVIKTPAPVVVPVSSIDLEEQNSDCHPGYSGCLKASASDYDCSGGSGNGPYYTGKVQVFGSDPFGLDRDGDGWGCE